MSDCTHDCSSCGESCAERQGGSPFQIKPLREGCRVGKVYGVVSGKGGVGKSMVTSQLAVTMQRRGHNVAVLDADITGPSIPKAFGIHGRAAATEDAILPVITGTGIQLMSVNLLLKHETDPVIWRGPVIGGVVQQFWGDVLWQDVDYMFVDMPPGTGDVALNVFQTLPVDGVIIVASPQELVSMVVQKAVKMAQMMNIPIVGLVENMLEVLNADFIRTARAKGLSERKVIYHHAFRNTLIPLVTIIGGSLPGLFSGALITETLYSIPGIGYISYQSMVGGDIPFSMFYLVFMAVLTLLGNLISDILYAVVDPRVRIA